MAIFANNFVTSDDALGGSVIERSLRYGAVSNTYLARTNSSAGNQKTWTYSFWMKRTRTGNINLLNEGNTNALPWTFLYIENHKFHFWNITSGGVGGVNYWYNLIRDLNAWYHIVLRVDTTQSTAANRVRLYINGTEATIQQDNRSSISQNVDTQINGTDEVRIGNNVPTNQSLKGYLADVYIIDGQSLDPTHFGYTESQTGLWRPKRYTGTYGTNGFHLEFNDNSGTTATTLGKDTSGNGNHWTPNNFSVSANLTNDSMPDTPSKNFCTLNALNATSSFNLGSFGGGLVFDQSSNDQAITGTFGVTSGKWYWEVYKNASQNPEIGIETLTQRYAAQSTGSSNTEVAFITNNGEMRKGADSNSHSITGGSAQTGAGWIRIACDMDNKKIWFSDTSGNYFNSGNPATGTNEAFDFSSVEVANGWTPYIYMGTGSGHNCYINFGQFDLNNFSSNIPTGFKTLNSKNLIPDVPSIIRPQKHFDTILWAGNGSSQTISGLEFAPDLVWLKCRNTSSGGRSHIFTDTVRGATKSLLSPESDAEDTFVQDLTAFTPDGFSVGSNGRVNENSANLVGWCWKAGGATTVSNTDGNQTTQVSVNEEAGFSIVTYTGTGSNTNIGHGLGAVPDMIITKSRSATGSWAVLDKFNTTAEYGFFLNDNGGYSSYQGGTFWNDTPPTSTVFRVGTNSATNASGVTYVAYCWKSIPGFSKIGKYTGNGNARGTYVYLGFRPAWVMVKRTDASANWHIWDNKRDPDNPVYGQINANLSSSESTGSLRVDFLSNGFKHRNSDGGAAGNISGGTYIYMAFAEQPGNTAFDTITSAR